MARRSVMPSPIAMVAHRSSRSRRALRARRCARSPRAAPWPRDGTDRLAIMLPGGAVIDAPRAALGHGPVAVLSCRHRLTSERRPARLAYDLIARDATVRAVRANARWRKAPGRLLGLPTSCFRRDWDRRLVGSSTSASRAGGAGPRSYRRRAVIGQGRGSAPVRAPPPGASWRGHAWVGRGDSLRAGSTLDLLAQALRGALGIYGASRPPAPRRLRARVAEHVPPTDSGW